ncbi:endolytic transglycosylase MltG [Pseudonocardia sp. GCM10023141]|uniref:endolytic transglycosylase MltG n=1 Tax=Pseudonocardia sp. GCM10023141 TaxID=3252653 RepID=UPI00360C50B2
MSPPRRSRPSHANLPGARTPAGGDAAARARRLRQAPAGASDPTVRLQAVPNRREALGARRAAQRNRARARRRRFVVLGLTLVVLLGVVIGGGLYVYSTVFTNPDFEGTGTGDVVVQVHDGDSTTQIGNTLADRGVVASVEAFTKAASTDERVRAVQPGYYQMKVKMSAASAVTLLLAPTTRVGQLEIKGGVQLDDTRAGDGAVVPGVLNLISQATCATIGGEKKCVSVDELRAAMVGTDPAALGVPSWALEAVGKADPARRLEGLLVPGRYDVAPGTPATEVLHGLLTTSAARLQASGLVSGAQTIGSTPYQVLIISSLVEKEAITADMPKVARVIYNRLGVGQRLELDSMVNYPLDLQALRTTPEDRARPGPYNSYAEAGLPPTPIAAPGRDAIAAAIAPAEGPWLFFVRCRTDGTSCFAQTLPEHQANVAMAEQNGAI